MEDLGPDPSPDDSGDHDQNASGDVIRYVARVCTTGRDVTVRRFAQPNPVFKNALEVAKKIW